jgi:hypothetical protein
MHPCVSQRKYCESLSLGSLSSAFQSQRCTSYKLCIDQGRTLHWKDQHSKAGLYRFSQNCLAIQDLILQREIRAQRLLDGGVCMCASLSLSVLYVYVIIFTCLCLYACAHRAMYAHVQAWVTFLYYTPSYFFETGSSTKPVTYLFCWIGWPASLWDPHVFCCRALG